MKLLATGLALLVLALGALLFTNLDPATLFIGGTACAFLGVINLISGPGVGSAVSATDMTEAERLANIQNYGSADGSARFIDHP
jgi:hypothetical protein